ncbi:MAG: hypothetical protein GPJ29_22395 [Microcystis aeruginosa BK11-02]|nr:hypothetical protein [Microcystis aeruginosa BK11-02]NCS79113.1 hypothetical protein [Microcystis aeruginosa K13-07]
MSSLIKKAQRLSMTALALIVITTSLVIISSPSNGQSLTGSPANPKLKFSTPLPLGLIHSPIRISKVKAITVR